jgi:hypothetical protein
MFWDGQSWKDVAGPIYFGLAFSSPLVAVKISVATVSP